MGEPRPLQSWTALSGVLGARCRIRRIGVCFFSVWVTAGALPREPVAQTILGWVPRGSCVKAQRQKTRRAVESPEHEGRLTHTSASRLSPRHPKEFPSLKPSPRTAWFLPSGTLPDKSVRQASGLVYRGGQMLQEACLAGVLRPATASRSDPAGSPSSGHIPAQAAGAQ